MQSLPFPVQGSRSCGSERAACSLGRGSTASLERNRRHPPARMRVRALGETWTCRQEGRGRVGTSEGKGTMQQRLSRPLWSPRIRQRRSGTPAWTDAGRTFLSPTQLPMGIPWRPRVRSDHTLLQPRTGAVPGMRSAHSLSSKEIKQPSRQL